MAQELHGWISEYTAQGMEGDVWLIFQDRAYARDREGGWDMAGMYRLQEKDALTIFDEQGQVLWSGVIATRPSGLFNLFKRRPGHPDWSPTDVSLIDWHNWFRHQPPLEAILKRP